MWRSGPRSTIRALHPTAESCGMVRKATGTGLQEGDTRALDVECEHRQLSLILMLARIASRWPNLRQVGRRDTDFSFGYGIGVARSTREALRL